jgi:hypothetical protein
MLFGSSMRGEDVKVLACLSAALFAFAATAEEAPRPKMALPQQFAQTAERLPVKRKMFTSGPARVGEYEIRDYSRGWEKTRRRSGPILPFPVSGAVDAEASTERSTLAFRFKVARDGEILYSATCDIRGESESVDVRGVPVSASGSRNLSCSFLGEGDNAAEWTLTVDAFGSLRTLHQTSAGTLTRSNRSLTIDGVNRVSGTSFRIPAPIGYTVSDGDNVIAAAETAGRELVMFDPAADAEERPVMVGAFAAIMFAE